MKREGQVKWQKVKKEDKREREEIRRRRGSKLSPFPFDTSLTHIPRTECPGHLHINERLFNTGRAACVSQGLNISKADHHDAAGMQYTIKRHRGHGRG